MGGIKKRDINFLKSSGFTKKQRMKASAGFLMMMLIIVLIGGLGGYSLKLWMDNEALDSQISKIQVAVNDPTLAPALEEYKILKAQLAELTSDVERCNKIKEALENKFRIPFDVLEVVYDELDHGGNDILPRMITITNFSMGADKSLIISGVIQNTQNPNEQLRTYVRRLADRVGTGSLAEVDENVVSVTPEGGFTINCKVGDNKEAQE